MFTEEEEEEEGASVFTPPKHSDLKKNMRPQHQKTINDEADSLPNISVRPVPLFRFHPIIYIQNLPTSPFKSPMPRPTWDRHQKRPLTSDVHFQVSPKCQRV